jgi:hypothetical protein
VGGMGYGYKILVGKLKEDHFGRLGIDDDIEVDLRKMSEATDWMWLSMDKIQLQAIVITVSNLHIPQISKNFLVN